MEEQAARERAQKEEREKREEEEIGLRRLEAMFNSKTEAMSKKKKILEGYIFEAERKVRRLEADLKHLEDIEAAEKAEKEQENSWGTWLSSPFYQKRQLSEEEKNKKEQDRIGRMHTKSIKSQKLAIEKAEVNRLKHNLMLKEAAIKTEQVNFDELKRIELEKIAKERYADRIRQAQEKAAKLQREARESREAWEKAQREQKERQEKEAREAREKKMQAQKEAQARRENEEKLRKMRELRQKAEREAAEREEVVMQKRRREQEAAVRNKLHEEWAFNFQSFQAEEKREEREKDGHVAGNKRKQNRQGKGPSTDRVNERYGAGRQNFSKKDKNAATDGNGAASESMCSHRKFWEKVDGAGDCDKCAQYQRKFLYQCPGCDMRACAECRRTLRGR